LSVIAKLYSENLITEKQYLFLESIQSAKIVSLYYELRLILYLGIVLFTSGLGYLAYENIGEFGHVLLMLLMAILIGLGFYFIDRKAQPYSNDEVKTPNGYFDYLLVLIALLIIGLFSYIQVYFELTELLLNYSSIITAIVFFLMAYRYNNKALLAMGITALVATFGLTITPVGWINGDWFDSSQLYQIAILCGFVIVLTGHLLARKSIKKHFLFTYQNYGLLLFFVGCIAATFDSYNETAYAFFTSIVGVAISIYSWYNKKFLFFLYANISGYIAITYLMFVFIFSEGAGYMLAIYYFPITLISYMGVLISKKAHFND